MGFYYVGRRVRRAGMTDANTVNYYSGTDTQATYKMQNKLPSSCKPVKRIRLRYGNQQNAVITVKGSIVVNSVIHQLTFDGGATSVVIQKGNEKWSDWLDISLYPDQRYDILSNAATSSSTEDWPISAPTVNTEAGDAYVAAADATLTNTGMSAAGIFGYFPSAIQGDCDEDSPAVLLLGDSIIAGVGDTGYGFGWGVRSCEDYNLAHQASALTGEQLTTAASTTFSERVKQLGFGTAVIEYGINDVNNSRTLAQLKADLLTMCTNLSNLGFRRILVSTLTPYDTFSGAKNTVRTDYNTWLRSGSAQTDNPLISAIIDVAAVVESATLGGTVASGGTFWASGMSGDGIHPNSTAVTAMKAVAGPIINSYAAAYLEPSTGGAGLTLGTTTNANLTSDTWTQIATDGSVFAQSLNRTEFYAIVSSSQPSASAVGRKIDQISNWTLAVEKLTAPLWVRSSSNTTLVVMKA